MIPIRRAVILAAMLVAVSCSKPTTPAPSAVQPKEAPPSAERIATMSIANVEVAPSPVRRSAPATFRVRFNGALPAVPLTLSWFGPDGWLTYDQMSDLKGDTASFALNAASFPSPGRYHYDLHSGTVVLGTGEIDVVD